MRTTIRTKPTPAPVASLALAGAARRAPLRTIGSESFAAAIVARHGTACAVAAPLQQVLAIPRIGTSIWAPQQHWHLAFAPRVALQLQVARERDTSRPPVAATASTQEAAAAPSPSIRIATVERIVARETRIDVLRGVPLPMSPVVPATAPAATSPITSAAPLPMPVAAAMPRVLRRSPEPAAPDARRASSAATPSSTALAVTTTSSPSHASPVAAPAHVDVEHLAERVVRVIDRRFTAARERLGRI